MEETESVSTIVNRLAAAKQKSGKTYTEIGKETGLTNVYVSQLFRRQAQLKPHTVPQLRSSLPHLTDDLIFAMMKPPPLRSYDPISLRDPSISRLNEAIMHYGESIKTIINEEFGDGIMSAVDFYCSVDKINGMDGNERVVITFDGKYLPYPEQRVENMVSKMSRPTM